MADEESTILLQSYDASTPKFSIQYSAVEESSSIKSSSKQLRRIRKVGFDTTYHRDYFAFISSEICCVYDVNDPDRPVNCVTIRNCSCSDTHRNDPNRFRSFAFSGNGTMLLLTTARTRARTQNWCDCTASPRESLSMMSPGRPPAT